jgi:NagD protein
VVVVFDSTLTYPRLCRAAWWIKQGKPYFATNPDRVCPTDQPTVLVDCGSICAALEAATGRPPAAVMGKPDPGMIRGILHRHALAPENLAMVGDRLYTDIVVADHAGGLGVLVLTGEATAAEAAGFSPAPDLIVADLAELGEHLRAAKAQPVSP